MSQAVSQRIAVKSCWPYFLVSDLAGTEAFCREKLGFEVAYEEPDHDFAIFCRNEVYVMFRQTRHDPAPLVNSRFHPGDFPDGVAPYAASIQVSNIKALHEELTDRGAEPTPLKKLPYGRETTVTLPDGYVLVFLQLKSG